jgi:hypothetical protein
MATVTFKLVSPSNKYARTTDNAYPYKADGPRQLDANGVDFTATMTADGNGYINLETGMGLNNADLTIVRENMTVVDGSTYDVDVF